ncbi:MAG: Asp23/Gls24 family envelope stress response protein [Oscillospiraceae bacterium]|nr:Asp23/Gls24 family envelope stress response protein [Oscillospiraceae bacterium]
MITKRTHLGNIIVTKQFFGELIGRTIVNCFGVVDMNADGPKQTVFETLPFLPKIFPKTNYIDKGISFKIINDKLYIQLHITVMYGVNVSSVVKSIQHKIKYVVEEETDIKVERVNVFIDGIKS